MLVRADLNAPLTPEGAVSDDTRLAGAVPTLALLTSSGARVVLCSHLGRPKGKRVPSASLSHVQGRLGELLDAAVGRHVPLSLAPDCVGPEAEAAKRSTPFGGVCLLENLRFHDKEEANDAGFARELASGCDAYVDDAFGAAHRAHASTTRVAELLPCALAGLLMRKELEFLGPALEHPARPFVAVVGGAKVSSKIGVLRALLDKVDALVLGGGMTYTFAAARGLSVGNSICETDKFDLAREIDRLARDKGVQLLLPCDVVVADRFAPDADRKVVPLDAIPDGWEGMDAGPEAIRDVVALLKTAKTVLWNGPLGVFEFDAFARGTLAVAEALANDLPPGAVTVVGGGDSVAAVNKAGVADKMTHVSTGGGAALELLEGKTLPGVQALDDA